MKKISMVCLGLAVITLVGGCEEKETEKNLVCTMTQNEDSMTVEQKISMTFKNDKMNHMIMDVNMKITDENVKESWNAFTEAMDNENKEENKEGISIKVNKDDTNYEYKVTFDVDVEKANKTDLETYGLEDLASDNGTLEENQKSAEADGFTCEVK